MSWIMPWGQLAWLRAYDDATARKAFDTPDSLVAGGPVPHYATTPVRNYTSFDQYAHEPQFGAPWVIFDLEAGAGFPAPAVEKRHPEMAIAAFASLASGRGQGLIATPSRDLVYVPGSDCPVQPGEDISAAYLRTGVPGTAAAAQVLLVQAQGVQKDPAAYAALIQGAMAQQPAGQATWAGLTTGGAATSGQMTAAQRAAAALGVSGFWVTIADQSQAGVAAAFLRDAVKS